MVDFRKSNDLECPATLTKMPCKGQLSEWRDLNECVFHICEDPFEFGKFNQFTWSKTKVNVKNDRPISEDLSETEREDLQTMSEWENEYSVYKKYLWPQWTNVLNRYIAAYQANAKNKLTQR